MHKDIEELRTISGIRIQRGETAATAYLEFLPTIYRERPAIDNDYSDYPELDCIQFSAQSSSLPSRFIITVPRFYPHNPPDVCCVDSEHFYPPYITPSGAIQHPGLTDLWSPLNSLTAVVEILQAVRAQVATQSTSMAGECLAVSHPRHSVGVNTHFDLQNDSDSMIMDDL